MKMKFSDAMMLAGTLDLKLDPMCWKGCLAGQAFYAVHSKYCKGRIDLGVEWPWLSTVVPMPKLLMEKLLLRDSEQSNWSRRMQAHTSHLLSRPWYSVIDIISSMAYMVDFGLMTREQVVEWIRSVEPEMMEPETVTRWDELVAA